MENRDMKNFERLLSVRLDTLDFRDETAKIDIHAATERLFIRLAFERIHNKQYWGCIKCGKDITEERMLKDPTTLMCIECATGAWKK